MHVLRSKTHTGRSFFSGIDHKSNFSFNNELKTWTNTSPAAARKNWPYW